jgi:Uma2 family endonuclease
MATAAQFLPLDQFEKLYEGEKPYYEYWFGEAIQKSVPTSLHGITQGSVFMLIASKGSKVSCEVKLRISPFANPVPDLIADPNPLESPYPTKPFALCVEVLSPDDDLRRVFQKSAHYLDWGIRTVWIIDPDKRKAYCMTGAQPQPAELFLSDSLTADAALSLPMRELFAQVDKLSS